MEHVGLACRRGAWRPERDRPSPANAKVALSLHDPVGRVGVQLLLRVRVGEGVEDDLRCGVVGPLQSQVVTQRRAPYLCRDPWSTKGPGGLGDLLLVVGWRDRPEAGSRWSARSNARTNDLDAGKGRCRIGTTRQDPRSVHRDHPQAGWGRWCCDGACAWAPSLILVRGPRVRRHDARWGDPPRRGGRSFFQGRPASCGPAGALRELAAAHQRGGQRAHGPHRVRPPVQGRGCRTAARRPARRARPGCGSSGAPACGPRSRQPGCRPAAA